MNTQPTPLWAQRPKRLFPRPHLPKLHLDSKDRAALRQVSVYSIAAMLASLAITCVIVVVCLWIRLALWVV